MIHKFCFETLDKIFRVFFFKKKKKFENPRTRTISFVGKTKVFGGNFRKKSTNNSKKRSFGHCSCYFEFFLQVRQHLYIEIDKECETSTYKNDS